MAWLVSWWDHVSGTVLRGLGITVVGMALVFFTLGLVILAMVLLTRLPWLRGKELPPDAVSAASGQADSDAPATVEEEDLAVVAGIAVAILRSRHRAPLQQRLQAGRSTWKSYGRACQLGL